MQHVWSFTSAVTFIVNVVMIMITTMSSMMMIVIMTRMMLLMIVLLLLIMIKMRMVTIFTEVISVVGDHSFEGSGPEWCISTMLYSRTIPFCSRTLEFFKIIIFLFL